MRKRTRVIVAAVMLVAGIAVVAVTAFYVATTTSFGNSWVRGIIESNVGKRLAAGVTFRMGRLARTPDGGWVIDSVLLTDSTGHVALSIARVTAEDLSLVSLVRGDIRLGIVVVDGTQFSLEKGHDGTWNTSRLFVQRGAALPGAAGFGRRVLADSIEVRNGRFDLTLPDALPSLPLVHRAFTEIQVAAGATTLLDGNGAGNVQSLRVSLNINDPPVLVKSAAGSVRWGRDSIELNLPDFRLPATHASVAGSIAWGEQGGAQLALDVIADTVAPADIRWMSSLIPSEGAARAKVAIRTNPRGDVRYEIAEFDLRAFESHVSGGFAVTPGRLTEVRDLQLTMAPLDLKLVRNVFGDTILKPAWQGAFDGRVVASGGGLDSLVIDSVVATFRDARIGGATSRFAASGAMNTMAEGTRLIGFRVRVDSLDIRTLGAVAHMADSLPGALQGTLTLDGPTSKMTFHDLLMRHVDGDMQQSLVTGSGWIASDQRTQWLEAKLALDTVAMALLQPDSLDIPLRGTVSGALALSAIKDTMTIDARLIAGEGTAHLAGTTLLDSTRTQMDISGTLARIDPRQFLQRRDIPALSLSGTMHLAVDDDKRRVDRHVEMRLDSSSRIGESSIASATLRFGTDSTGIHLDTASVIATTWAIEARGQLAAHGKTSTDSITFATRFDSLGAIRMLLLDSAGAPIFESLDGNLKTTGGVVRGSFEHAAISTEIGTTGVRFGTTAVGSSIGQLALNDLPDSTTGTFRGTLTDVEWGTYRADSASVTASIEGGTSARVAGRVAEGDATEISFGAKVTWPDSIYTVQVDSLDALVLGHRWQLALPATVQVARSAISVDSLKLQSDSATIIASGSVPDNGPIAAAIEVRGLGFSELALLGLVPEDMTGLITAMATITGTRDAPTINATAVVNPIRPDTVSRPSLTFEGSYAAKQATVNLAVVLDGGTRVLEAQGDVPVDLTFRRVDDRVIDAPMSLNVRADSLSLALFEGLLPRVSSLGGRVTADLDVGGTPRRPRGSGTVALAAGSFDLRRYGFSARNSSATIKLAGDSVIVEHLSIFDGDSPGDSIGVIGVVQLTGRKWTEWSVALHSVANRFRVIDDPRVATAEADWTLDVSGLLAEPRVKGSVRLPYGVFTIGPQRRPRAIVIADSPTETSVATPNLDGVLVSLGSNVRLKSRDANVQLEGDLELFGPLSRPWISGTVSATRGTYRVNVGGVLTRTFRVDSGYVVLEGTSDIPPALDIYTSYVVRRPDDDVVIHAHLYGTTDRPRLDLSSELGSAVSQSEIISYLVFGRESFALQGSRQANISTATAPFLPTIGGWLEGMLGGVMPFFNTLQVTSTVFDDAPQNLFGNPIETTLNNYALTGGKQIGTDTWFSLSAGRCGGSRSSGTGSVPFWGGTSIEYRPKRTVGASLSIDPGPAPCSGASAIGGNLYQFGLDLSYDWRFRRKR